MIRRIARLLRDPGGAASVEFAIAFPFFIWILMMMTEVGVLTLRTSLLKRGLSVATRDVRLGDPGVMTLAGFRERVCAHAFTTGDCQTSLNVEMRPIDGASFESFKCVNRENAGWTPVTTFTPGAPEQIMLVRACLLVHPVFPGSGIGADLARSVDGDYAIVAMSAFMNEPK